MYIQRNEQGAIVAISNIPQDGLEIIADDAAELQSFLSTIKTPQQIALENSDHSMARVLEDVINLLIEQGTIRFTDLPEAAQTKLLSRRELRDLQKSVYRLSDDESLTL